MRSEKLLALVAAAALAACGETPSTAGDDGGPGASGDGGSGGGAAGAGGAGGAGGTGGTGGAGGTGGTGGTAPDPSDALFAPDHLVEVAIELPGADWDALRAQTRTVISILAGDCLSHPPESPFTWFPAKVTIDGEVAARAGVRKKGLLGSMDAERPSLKIDLEEYGGTELHGVEKLTLNNARQDPSLVRQCLAYGAFAAAGLPASRCNFAHVTVNGTSLGVYVNVEAPSKRMIRRHFADDAGNLYEGTLSDFVPAWRGTFEKKTNEADPAQPELDRAIAAVAAPDDRLLEELDAAFDLEQFVTYWAMEVLVTAWDGYASNLNNFFVYGDPSDGRLRFLPWGIDMSFVARNPFDGGRPEAVAAEGALARRLYLHPEGRRLYLERLRTLLDEVWDEDALLAEVDRMAALVEPAVRPGDRFAFGRGLEQVRDVIRGRRAQLEPALAGDGPAWPYPPKEPFCIDDLGSVAGTFETTFGTLGAPDPFRSGSGTLTIDYLGEVQSPRSVGGNAGHDPNAQDGPRVLVQQIAPLADGRYAVVILSFPPELATPGTFALDWAPSLGALLAYDPRTDTAEQVGLLGGGQVTLEACGVQDGDEVRGSYQAELLEWIF